MTAKEVANDILRRCYVDHTKEPDTVFKGLDVEIEEAILQERERTCTFIEEQNSMVNTLWGEKTEPGRHDAFVRDIVRAIREGKPNG